MVLVVVSFLAVVVTFFYFRHAFKSGLTWRVILIVAMAVAGVRTTAVGFGTYLLWKSGGSAQILGYVLVLAGLPEMALVGRQRPGAAGQWLITALATVALGSLLWVITVALIALRVRKQTNP